MEIINVYNSLCNDKIFDKSIFYVIDYNVETKTINNNVLYNDFVNIKNILY